MKRLISIFAAFTLTAYNFSVICAYGAEKPDVSAKAAVLISADTGEVIYALNCNEKLPMASTTKIMTTLLCLESGGLYDEFVVDSDAIKVEGSSMGLCEGDTVTKYALCCGMLLPSGNDAANAAAVKIAGSIETFAELMNERARKLGLSKTFFVTPSGLEGEGHGSSAFDMAMLAREALRNEIFRSICSQKSMKLEFGNPPYERWLKNTNKLLSMYDGVYGVKTGFTDEAGRCLVSACERGGKDLICVTLNDRNDWNDHMALYDYGFETARKFDVQLPLEMSVDVVGGDSEKLKLLPEKVTLPVTSLAGNEDDITYELLSAPFEYAPVHKGDKVAELRVSFMGREVETVPLYAAEDIAVKAVKPEQHKKGIFAKIKEMLGELVLPLKDRIKVEKIRIQKMIADSGVCSRRKAEELITKGRVKVNGHPVKLGDKCGFKDIITIDGERIYMPKKRSFMYLMMNKPRGYVTTVSDELDRRCVMDLLEDVEERVYPVGRLDRNSEGLLLFTNDGEFANSIMHPSRHISKTYRVTVRPDINDEQLVRLSEGVEIDGRKTLPATVVVKDKTEGRVVLLITIKEGRNRQIRKMCEAVGLEVARLRRISIGPLKLGMLKPGSYRELTPEELRAIRNAIGKEK